MANSAQSKGKKGEKQAQKWLLENLPITSLDPSNVANLRCIGDDLELLHFSIEVKRRETLDIQGWWYQCVVNADKKQKEPILMFRQNRKQWRWCVSARNMGLSKGYIELGEVAFKEFVTMSIERELEMRTGQIAKIGK